MKYSITSVENWEKYLDTGNNNLLNDIQYWLEKYPDKVVGSYNVVIAWKGGSVKCIILS